MTDMLEQAKLNLKSSIEAKVEVRKDNLGFHTRREALDFIKTPEIWGEPVTITFQVGKA